MRNAIILALLMLLTSCGGSDDDSHSDALHVVSFDGRTGLVSEVHFIPLVTDNIYFTERHWSLRKLLEDSFETGHIPLEVGETKSFDTTRTFAFFSSESNFVPKTERQRFTLTRHSDKLILEKQVLSKHRDLMDWLKALGTILIVVVIAFIVVISAWIVDDSLFS